MAVVNQLIPFNKGQFDACMAYLGQAHSKVLSQFELVKLHVMIDVYHILSTGRPIIGGPLEKWPHGAVVKPAYKRLRNWGYSWERHESLLNAPFSIEKKTGDKFYYKPLLVVERDDFSGSELRAMEQAWNCVIERSHGSDDFFHDPRTFMGLAWTRAKDKQGIAWSDIIAAYDELNSGADHRYIQQLISA